MLAQIYIILKSFELQVLAYEIRFKMFETYLNLYNCVILSELI